jgi:hypothetical protein
MAPYNLSMSYANGGRRDGDCAGNKYAYMGKEVAVRERDS